MSKNIDDGSKRRKIDIRRKRDGYVVTIDGFPYLIQGGQLLADGRIEFIVDGKTFRAVVAKEGDESFVLLDGQTYNIKEIEDEFVNTDISSNDALKAPMPGRITKIFVKVGDIVNPKQQLMILEAMKMENVITAPIAGKVAKINYKINEQVKDGEILLVIDPLDKIGKKNS